jgi:hypothetical protein
MTYYVATSSSADLTMFHDFKFLNPEASIDLAAFEAQKKPNADYIFISEQRVQGYPWASRDRSANYVIVKTSDVLDESVDQLENVILLVDDESKFFDSFLYVYDRVTGNIDIQIKNEFDSRVLSQQFADLVPILSDSIKENDFVHVKHLNSFFTKEKFGAFGVEAFFVSPDLNVYYHPGFYYDQSKPIATFQDFSPTEFVTHFSKPHILCHNCESFYCDRSVYSNKTFTSELKAPAFTECRKTTFLAYFSKKIFNIIQDQIELVEYEMLDKVDADFDAEREYNKLLKNMSVVNNIKGIDLNYLRGI